MGRPKKDVTLRGDESIQYVNIPISKKIIAKIDKKLKGMARCRYILNLIEADTK